MKKLIALISVFALLIAVAPLASANATIVSNDNSAVVVNEVHAGANTGLNYAGGSSGGDGGDGGDIYNGTDECGECGDGDVEDSTTGNGGNGGDGSEGGYIQTGSASANAGVLNVVNTNKTTVDNCGCDGEGHEFTGVFNRNRAVVANGAGAGANSGLNAAAGSEGGSGGEGGEIDNEGDDVDESDTGDGGDGGNGGLGGAVVTGEASSHAGAINVVNTNITRIRR